jgi:hypothetical protein
LVQAAQELLVLAQVVVTQFLVLSLQLVVVGVRRLL